MLSQAGGNNLNLTGTAAGNTFTLSGATLTNKNIVVTGFTSGSNALVLQTGYATQTFNITSANTGNVTGLTDLTGTFTFSNIGNLTGGTNNNSFVFSNAAPSAAALMAAAGTAPTSLDYSYTPPRSVVNLQNFNSNRYWRQLQQYQHLNWRQRF